MSPLPGMVKTPLSMLGLKPSFDKDKEDDGESGLIIIVWLLKDFLDQTLVFSKLTNINYVLILLVMGIHY